MSALDGLLFAPHGENELRLTKAGMPMLDGSPADCPIWICKAQPKKKLIETTISDQTHTEQECMKLTDECRVYRNTYFECKRSQLDMRTRIRGMKQR